METYYLDETSAQTELVEDKGEYNYSELQEIAKHNYAEFLNAFFGIIGIDCDGRNLKDPFDMYSPLNPEIFLSVYRDLLYGTVENEQNPVIALSIVTTHIKFSTTEHWGKLVRQFELGVRVIEETERIDESYKSAFRKLVDVINQTSIDSAESKIVNL